MAAETVQTNIKFRILASLPSSQSPGGTWNILSFWSKASDVELENGKTVEQVLGEISGITSLTKITTRGATTENSDAISETKAGSALLVNYLAGEVISSDINTSSAKSLVAIYIPNVVGTGGWVTSSTSYGGITYKYKYEIEVADILVPHPMMYLYGNINNPYDSYPGVAEKKMWADLEMITNIDSGTGRKYLIFLTECKPTTALNIGLKGVVLS